MRAIAWVPVLVVALALAGCGGARTSAPASVPSPVAPLAANPAAPTATVQAARPTEPSPPTATASPTAPRPTATFAPVAPTATATATPEPPTSTPEPCPGAISWDQAIDYAGQEVTVIGPVVDATWANGSRGQPTFLNLGLSYPDPGRFTILMWIDARYRFDAPPEELFAGKTVCVSGVVELYRDGAEMEVEYPSQIVVP